MYGRFRGLQREREHARGTVGGDRKILSRLSEGPSPCIPRLQFGSLGRVDKFDPDMGLLSPDDTTETGRLAVLGEIESEEIRQDVQAGRGKAGTAIRQVPNHA